ncbi:MAG: DMT family transporter [Alphaproteobacteria bacterium]
MTPSCRAALLAYLMLTGTALFWSGNVVFGRGVSDQLPPLGLNFWRWTVALLILLPFTWRTFVEQRSVIIGHWKILFLLAVLGITGFNSLAYIAFQTTTAINAALINTLMPIFVVAITVGGFREPISKRQFLGLLSALAGTSIILTRGDPQVLLDLDFTTGDIVMVVGMVGYALYSVLLRYRPPGLDGTDFLAIIAAIGVVLALPLYIAETVLVGPMPVTLVSVGMVAYVALFASVLAYTFWNRGVAVIGANRASLFLNLMPVFTAIAAIAFLGESLETFHFTGMALVFLGLLLATRKSRVHIDGS